MSDILSAAQIFATLTTEEQLEHLDSLSPEARAGLRWSWPFWARKNQLEPEGDWTNWLILAGRGFGKTRTGGETVRSWTAGPTPLTGGRFKHIALVAETSSDARDVIVEGPAGILAITPKDFRPIYEPSKRRLTWPNGASATLFNAVEPDQLRGPQHDAAWCDELAKWRYVQETWDQLQFGLRLGPHPKCIITTTPRPIPLVKKLVTDPNTFVTRGRTFDNADNLAAPFLRQIEERYGGTRLGRQELEGEILGDIPGALWSRENIDASRVKEHPDLSRVIVAVDPAASSEEGSDETGIVGVGSGVGPDGFTEGFVLSDRSLKGTPEEWAKAAVKLYRELEADRIVAEKNQGGEMVEAVIKAVDRTVPVTLVHASRGKYVRAEPVSALYEQGRVHHVGRFDKLEDQMCMFTSDIDRKQGSPDRVDALVWGLTHVFDKIVGRRKKKAVAGDPTIVSDSDRRQSYSEGNSNMWMVG